MAKNTGKGLTIALLTIGGIALIGGLYLGVKALGGTKKAKKPADTPPKKDETKTTTTTTIDSGLFPLKKGSKNSKVTQLQYALMGHGESLPKYGADGDFGSETEKALVNVTGKTSVASQQELDYIINSQPSYQPAPATPTKTFWDVFGSPIMN